MISYDIAQFVALMNQVFDMVAGLENYTPDEVLSIRIIMHEPRFGCLQKTSYQFPKQPIFSKSYQAQSGIRPDN